MAFGLILFLIFSSVFGHIDVDDQKLFQPRMKRGASGALSIVTNHAQPIHADVKSESTNENTVKTVNEQPCPQSSGPAHIEPGVGFKVTPPKDAVTFEPTSLRRSFAAPSVLTLIRSISRVVTLVVLFISAILEFYPTFHDLICEIVSFMSAKQL